MVPKAMNQDQLILALDVPSASESIMWMERMKSRVGCFKIGLQLFCAHGPELVRQATERDVPVFLDLKLHDIPNTVASAIRSLNGLNIRFLTLHTQGGTDMIEAALGALPPSNAPQLLGVTVLTSLSDKTIADLGYPLSASDQALHLARLSAKAGLDGFVSSPLEARAIRDAVPMAKAIVTPGVRPSGSAADDQSRVTTPQESLDSGATHVVIGRPILKAEHPEQVVDSILAS